MSIELTKPVQIGTTQASVPPLGFGGASVGNLYRSMSDSQAYDTLAHCLRQGINYIDTAPHYGHGLSEVRIGNFLSQLNSPHPVLSTKVGRILVPAGPDGPNDYGFVNPLPYDHIFDYSYSGIMKSFDQSCHRLGIDKVDILYMHDIGKLTPVSYTHLTLPTKA